MKKDKKYGEFSYRSRKFRKSLAFLCLTALLVPSASFGVNAAETAGQNAAQAAGGWVTDTESAVQGQGLQFSIPQISVYYGQQLKDAYLSGTATDALGQTVRGTFSWVYPETVLDKVGTVLAEAVFTPAAEMPVTETPAAEVSAAGTPVGQEGWASAEISAGTDASAPLPKQYLSVNVTVEPAPVDVVEDPWTATPLKEGLLLKDIRLEGGKAVTGYPAPYTETDGTETVVSGSFSWADPDAVLTAGRQEVTVIFTPDQKEYRTAKTVLTLEAEETEEPEQPEKPQMPQLYLSCPDIFYGEKAEAKAWAEGEQQPFITYSYEGNGQTVYPESETPPKAPGSYVACAQVHESELFEPAFLYENFKIKRAVPDVDISADRTEVKGGGRVKLKISVQNPYDDKLKKGLPIGISLSFSGKPPIRLEQDLKGSDGSYTAVFSVPDENGEIICRVYTEANDFYENGGAAVTVRAKKNDKPSGGNQDSGNSHDDGKHESHKKDEEEEPVIKTPEEVEAEFWQDVIFRIYKAQEKGETVTINAKGHGQMPDKVMEALRGHKKVTLALVWEGDMILIPAGKAPAAKKGGAAWTLMELSKQFPAPKANANPGKPSGSQNPPAQSKPPVQPPAKPAPQNQTGSSGNTGTHFGNNTTAGVEHTEAETESTETTEEMTETETESAETESESTETIESVPETETDENADAGKKTDWLTVAACVCAGAGLIAVLVAIAALVLKNRGDL